MARIIDVYGDPWMRRVCTVVKKPTCMVKDFSKELVEMLLEDV
jgi:hypothetical protein